MLRTHPRSTTTDNHVPYTPRFLSLPGQSARGKRRMTSIVRDASASLAMLRDEPGGDKVADVLNGSHMCVVNLAEVTSHFVHNDMPPHEVDAKIGRAHV